MYNVYICNVYIYVYNVYMCVCVHAMEYCSAIKRNETELFVEMWMDLESVIQSEVSQKEENIVY